MQLEHISFYQVRPASRRFFANFSCDISTTNGRTRKSTKRFLHMKKWAIDRIFLANFHLLVPQPTCEKMHLFKPENVQHKISKLNSRAKCSRGIQRSFCAYSENMDPFLCTETWVSCDERRYVEWLGDYYDEVKLEQWASVSWQPNTWHPNDAESDIVALNQSKDLFYCIAFVEEDRK